MQYGVGRKLCLLFTAYWLLLTDMADTFLLEIVTPDRLFLSEQVDEMTAPGSEGEFGVLAGHAPLLTSLNSGELSYKKGADINRIMIGPGYAEVGPQKVTILTEQISTKD